MKSNLVPSIWYFIQQKLQNQPHTEWNLKGNQCRPLSFIPLLSTTVTRKTLNPIKTRDGWSGHWHRSKNSHTLYYLHVFIYTHTIKNNIRVYWFQNVCIFIKLHLHKTFILKKLIHSIYRQLHLCICEICVMTSQNLCKYDFGNMKH